MKYRKLTTDEFLQKPVPEKIPILLDTLSSDPKAASHSLGKWRNQTALETLAAIYFQAKLLAATQGNSAAEKEAWRCVVLADGINEAESFTVSGGSLRLPRSFADAFPGLMKEAEHYWNSDSSSVATGTPSFVLQTGESDLDFRRVLMEKPEGMDYWPIAFDRTYLQKDGGIEKSLSREDIARMVIRAGASDKLRQIGRNAKVVTLGSCFAGNLCHALTARGISCSTLRIEEVINTTLANKLFLDRCINGAAHPELDAVVDGRDLSGLKTLIGDADLVLLTVGVAPVMEWVDSGELCVVEKYRPLLDAGRIRQRFTTVDENRENIAEIVRIVKAFNPKTQVCITLSPVPLIAAIGGSSVVERDTLSKSILKVAIEEARQTTDFFYWPSFEVVKWIAPHILSAKGYQAYASDDMNSRHVSRWLVDVVVDEFIAAVFR